MPFNKLHVPQDLPVAMCHAINDLLHDSLVETCNVNPNDYFCLVSRYAPSDMIFHPTFLGERDPAATIVIEIALLSGRSDTQKEALFTDLRRRMGEIGFEPANSIMFLIENNAIDWSFSKVLRLTRSDPFYQLLACCHADSPLHVVMLPPASPAGSRLREATGQLG